jgi:rRNA processing protein Gar1
MNSQFFRVVKPTLNGSILLESDDVTPVEKPRDLLYAGKKVGRINETIGRVDSPLYVASLQQGVNPKELEGKRLAIR